MRLGDTMNKVKEDISIQQLIKHHPEALDIMKSLGFEDIMKPGMIQTVGRVMTLKKGCRMKKIDYENAKKAFQDHGIEFTPS